MSVVVVLPYPPSANRYLRHTARGTYRTAEANEYRTKAGWLAKAAGARLTAGPVDLTVTLHPKLTAKGRASGTVLDLSNCLKVAEDALQGIAFENDRQVKRITLAYGVPLPGGGLTLEIIT